MEFLWVRWFGIDPEHRYGHRAARLPKIGFVPDSDPVAFGFLDPLLVLRGCHLIPAFNDGRTSDLLMASCTAARPPHEDDDWAAFYVNIFADRDMFMRHTGGGVGHSFINPEQDIIGDDDSRDVDIGNAGEDDDRGFGDDEDALDHEGDPDKEEDDDEFDDDDDDDEEDASNADDDELGPEDGEDVDYSDEEDNFGNF